MKSLRKILFTLFGIENYLKLVSRTYVWMIQAGFYKKKYPEIFFLKKLIHEGDTCIDIGANLGYYSYFMSKHIGAHGKLIAVEPVPLFGKIWGHNMRRLKSKNFQLFSCALGEKEGSISMGTPQINGVLHHGMTHVIDENTENVSLKFNVQMKIADTLFSDIEKLDFVKVDVEGYEHLVFGNMINTIDKFRPVIQSELSGSENRSAVISLLRQYNYEAMVLRNGELTPATDNDIESGNSDFYFIQH